MVSIYRNLKTSKDVTVLQVEEHGVQVQYVISKHKSWYTKKNFYKLFIKVN